MTYIAKPPTFQKFGLLHSLSRILFSEICSTDARIRNPLTAKISSRQKTPNDQAKYTRSPRQRRAYSEEQLPEGGIPYIRRAVFPSVFVNKRTSFHQETIRGDLQKTLLSLLITTSERRILFLIPAFLLFLDCLKDSSRVNSIHGLSRKNAS
jgi:hypothetical protein